jgi:hypothetical protein
MDKKGAIQGFLRRVSIQVKFGCMDGLPDGESYDLNPPVPPIKSHRTLVRGRWRKNKYISNNYFSISKVFLENKLKNI